jgi:hypothetical protein
MQTTKTTQHKTQPPQVPVDANLAVTPAAFCSRPVYPLPPLETDTYALCEKRPLQIHRDGERSLNIAGGVKNRSAGQGSGHLEQWRHPRDPEVQPPPTHRPNTTHTTRYTPCTRAAMVYNTLRLARDKMKKHKSEKSQNAKAKNKTDKHKTTNPKT